MQNGASRAIGRRCEGRGARNGKNLVEKPPFGMEQRPFSYNEAEMGGEIREMGLMLGIVYGDAAWRIVRKRTGIG